MPAAIQRSSYRISSRWSSGLVGIEAGLRGRGAAGLWVDWFTWRSLCDRAIVAQIQCNPERVSSALRQCAVVRHHQYPMTSCIVFAVTAVAEIGYIPLGSVVVTDDPFGIVKVTDPEPPLTQEI